MMPTAVSASPISRYFGSRSVVTSIAAPTTTKKIGMKKFPMSCTSRSICFPLSVRASTSPAANEPMMIAEPTRCAMYASRNANTTDAKKIPRAMSIRSISRISAGASREPMTIASTTNPNAMTTTFSTDIIDSSPPPASVPQSVSSTSPIMSSTTAAPRMTCDSGSLRWPRSERTRAVIPTDVAVSAAPRNTETIPL